jgi:hypothetical protein
LLAIAAGIAGTTEPIIDDGPVGYSASRRQPLLRNAREAVFESSSSPGVCPMFGPRPQSSKSWVRTVFLDLLR